MASGAAKPGRKDREAPFTKPGALKLLKKAFTEQNEDWDTEDLLDVIHWQRQILGVICGLIWGSIPLTGFWAFAGYLVLNQIVVLSWWRTQRIDEDEHGGTQALMGEGLPPSLGLFLVVWILTFTIGGAYKRV